MPFASFRQIDMRLRPSVRWLLYRKVLNSSTAQRYEKRFWYEFLHLAVLPYSSTHKKTVKIVNVNIYVSVLCLMSLCITIRLLTVTSVNRAAPVRRGYDDDDDGHIDVDHLIIRRYRKLGAVPGHNQRMDIVLWLLCLLLVFLWRRMGRGEFCCQSFSSEGL